MAKVPPAVSSALEAASAEMWRRHEFELDKGGLEAALASGDPGRWRPLLGQARHFNVPREKGIQFLLPYLKHPNPEVRSAAAQYLFELGSREGGPVLVEFLTAAAAGNPPAVDLQAIANLLHQYRFPVEPDLVYAAYKQRPSSRLLMQAQLRGSPAAILETKERLLSHKINDGAMMMAGIMGLRDSESLAVYEANFSAESGARRMYAAAALYRVTGDLKYLEYLIQVAEATVGLRPPTGLLDYSTTETEAFRVLQQSVVPAATEALRRVEAEARKIRNELAASRALFGLFYFHRDYDYIDRLILAQFSGKLPPGLAIAGIWDLAAARRTPEIEAAAKAHNIEAYEREFLRKAGRPVESWIFQYISPEVPARLHPPLPLKR